MLFDKPRIVPKVLLIVFCLIFAAFAVNAFAADPVTPDRVVGLFDTWTVAIMIGWGIVQTRVPALKGWVNNSVGWVNAIGYILTKLLGGTAAHAAGAGALAGGFGTLVLGALINCGAAHVAYEALLRAPLDKLLKKYDPKHPGGWKLAGN